MAGAGLLALAAPGLAAKGDLVLISRATGLAGAPGDQGSSAPSISANGDRVAFESVATNLSAEDNPGLNVFVREAGTNTTTLASRASGAAGCGRRRLLNGSCDLRRRALRGVRVGRRQPLPRR